MKFRALIGILTVAMIVLFALVIWSSQKLKDSEADLQVKNESLVRQKSKIDSLLLVTQNQLGALARATDSVFYNVAKKANTFPTYKNYLATFGKNGEHYTEVLKSINELFPKRGYVQFKESNGKILYNKFKDTVGFPEKPIIFDGVNSISRDNLYVSSVEWTIRKGIPGHSDFPNSGTTGDFIRENQKVRVDSVIDWGSSKWIYIAYGN